MRGFLFVAASLIAIASSAAPHAIAAEAHQSLAGEVGAVVDAFQFSELGKQDFANTYPLQLANHLTGRWILVNFVATQGEKPSDGGLVSDCESNSVRINAGDPFNIRIIEAPDTDHEYEVTLASLGGMSFQMQPAIAMLEKANHFDPKEEYHRSSILSVVKATSGPTVLVHPSPNVLLLQLVGQDPQIFARCP